MYTDSMEQTLYSPVSPQPMAYNESTNYYNGQAFITPVSPYECRPEYERESVFSELRAVDSIIDSTVSVLRQFDSLHSTSTSSRDAPVCDTYSMSTTNSVSSACVYVPPPPQDREGRVGGSSSPGSSCSSHNPVSPSSVEDLSSTPRRRCAPYMKSKKKYIVPGTIEYNEKRERNNVAVRKSRAKAKNRQQDNERRMCELQMENERLNERLETITKELVVLKGLFKNMGASVPPGFSKMFQS